MRKSTLNPLVDLSALLAILLLVGTGLILRFSMPPGSGGRGLQLWDLGRHDWGTVHFWIAVVLAATIILHLVLHWPWVCGTSRRLLSRASCRTGRPTVRALSLSCVSFLVVVIGGAVGFLILANASVSESAERAREHAHEKETGQMEVTKSGSVPGGGASAEHGEAPRLIRGSMTLAEVERETGVPAARLIAVLDLPEQTSLDARLGRLCEANALEMEAVRSRIIEEASGDDPDERERHP